MAIFTSSDSNYLQQANPWASSITALTMSCWVRWATTTNYRCPLSIDYGGSSTNWLYIEPETSNIRIFFGSGGDFSCGAMSASVWYFVAAVFDGTNQDVLGYSAAVTAASLSTGSNLATGVSSLPNTCDINIGRNLRYTSEYLNGRVCHVKIWDAVLTQAEIERERWSRRPQRWADLKAWYPLEGATVANSLVDYGPNALDLTHVGTCTVEDNAPIGWGASECLVGFPTGPGIPPGTIWPTVSL